MMEKRNYCSTDKDYDDFVLNAFDMLKMATKLDFSNETFIKKEKKEKKKPVQNQFMIEDF